MINIKRCNNTISISGHANYDVYGKDIVCASVSSIITTAVNIIMNIDSTAISYQDDGKEVVITNNNSNVVVNTILDTVFDELKDLANQYKKYIKIESEGKI
ncbi:MAG: ribosomal-processing cysteine protease Prp [Bacilli bacterium]|nr:ribosomal-processing cysteine protease Prp [Bacilli bacterium]